MEESPVLCISGSCMAILSKCLVSDYFPKEGYLIGYSRKENSCFRLVVTRIIPWEILAKNKAELAPAFNYGCGKVVGWYRCRSGSSTDNNKFSQLSVFDRSLHYHIEKKFEITNASDRLAFFLLESIRGSNLNGAFRYSQSIFYPQKSRDTKVNNSLSGNVRETWSEIPISVMNLGDTTDGSDVSTHYFDSAVEKPVDLHSNELKSASVKTNEKFRLYSSMALNSIMDPQLEMLQSALASNVNQYTSQCNERTLDILEKQQSKLLSYFKSIRSLKAAVSQSRALVNNHINTLASYENAASLQKGSMDPAISALLHPSINNSISDINCDTASVVSNGVDRILLRQTNENSPTHNVNSLSPTGQSNIGSASAQIKKNKGKLFPMHRRNMSGDNMVKIDTRSPSKSPSSISSFECVQDQDTYPQDTISAMKAQYDSSKQVQQPALLKNNNPFSVSNVRSAVAPQFSSFPSYGQNSKPLEGSKSPTTLRQKILRSTINNKEADVGNSSNGLTSHDNNAYNQNGEKPYIQHDSAVKSSTTSVRKGF